MNLINEFRKKIIRSQKFFFNNNSYKLIVELKKNGITNKNILDAIKKIPRELFVSKKFAKLCYENIPLPIDCNQTISQPYVVAFMIECLKLKNIELHIEKLDSIILEANQILISSIFSNIIDNAIKYTLNNKNIYISLYKEDDKIYFVVKDEGIGISKANLSKITNRFYRVDESRNKTIKGFGLGLSIVKNSIQLHNGSLNITSLKNIGTIVKIRL